MRIFGKENQGMSRFKIGLIEVKQGWEGIKKAGEEKWNEGNRKGGFIIKC